MKKKHAHLSLETHRDNNTAYNGSKMAFRQTTPHGVTFHYFTPGDYPLSIGIRNLTYYTLLVEENRSLPNSHLLCTGIELHSLIAGMINQCLDFYDSTERKHAKEVIREYKKLYLRLTGRHYYTIAPSM